MKPEESIQRLIPELQKLFGMLSVAMLLSLTACGAVMEQLESSNSGRKSAPFNRSMTLFSQGNYEEAFQENQKALATGEAPADVALFNMGLISAYSLNPKKDYATALGFFRRVVKEHPKSPLTEQAQVWTQVLEEYQKIMEEKQQLLEEKKILTQEKESLARERQQLAREQDKLKKMVEKSRQIDLEIEERIRRARLRNPQTVSP